MATQRSDDHQRSRQEAALLLRLDPTNLSPADELKCDLISTLRLSIDSAQADALEGRAADLGRLIVATESLVKLLPSERPEANRPDDTEAMIAPLRKLYRHLHEQVHTLSAENAQLRAQLGLPVSGAGSSAITPAAADITPPGEWRGVPPMRAPDDPKPPVTIEGKAMRAGKQGASAAPASRPPDFDDTPGGKAWQSWVDGGRPGHDRWGNYNE